MSSSIPGRKPFPTQHIVNIREADKIQSRDSTQSKLSAGPLRAPSDLSDTGKKIWRLVVNELETANVVAKVDGVALRHLVDAETQYQRARELVEAEGLTVIDERGIERGKPAARVMIHFDKVVHRWCAEFGLTPSARTRIDFDSRQPDLGGWENL